MNLAALRSSLAEVAGPHGLDDAACAARWPQGSLPLVCSPKDITSMSACIRAAHANGAVIVATGRGRRLGWGNPPERCDLMLSTRRLDRVVSHQPADMTIVVEAGVTLAQIDEQLRPHGQRLPIDPPFPEETTVGGLIATDVFGPLRGAHGKVRDHLIGIRAVLADGTLVQGGGRVVKNVAGYDVMKLLTGSFGTLAVVVEAAFKLRPRPTSTLTGLRRDVDVVALVEMATSLRDLPFTPAMARAVGAGGLALAGNEGPALVIGLEGTQAEVDAQRQSVEQALPGVGLEWHASESLQSAARHAQAWGHDGGDVVGLRIGVPTAKLGAVAAEMLRTTKAVGAAARSVFDPCAGSAFLRVPCADVDDPAGLVARLRATAAKAGGFAVVDDRPASLADRFDAWGEIGAAELMRGIKAAIDPERRLSPGRFAGGI